MPYIIEICRTGKIIEVAKYHCARWNCKGEKRQRKRTETIKAQEKVNQRLAAKTLRRLMNNNFTDSTGYLITLDYRKELRPAGSAAMQDDIKAFMRLLRKEYSRQNYVLKYIYTKEIGPRGANHVHMMLSNCDNVTDVLRRCWKKGGIHIDPLTSDGQYEGISNYFVKYADKTIETEGRLVGKRYYCSRNLIRPEPIKHIVKNVDTYYENIKPVKGYYVEKPSIISGVTQAGFGYFAYMLHKIDNEEGD